MNTRETVRNPKELDARIVTDIVGDGWAIPEIVPE